MGFPDVIITPKARVVLERFLSSVSVQEWLNEETATDRTLFSPGFRWEDFFSKELRENNHKRTAERASYEAEKFLNEPSAKYVLNAWSMADWIDEEMTEPEHADIWPKGYLSVHNERTEFNLHRSSKRK